MRVDAQVQQWEGDEKDSSIYDFNTYDEGKEAVRLLIENGFDAMDLWLVGKGRPGERHPLRAALTRIGVSREKVFNHESARKAGPHILMMRGNSVQAGKAHDVLVERTNALIEECLQFR